MEDSLQTYVITLPTLKAEVVFSVPKLEKWRKMGGNIFQISGIFENHITTFGTRIC